MTAKTTRFIKEARSLWWSWCVVCIAGLLPLIHLPSWINANLFRDFDFFFGIPLLATLPLGNEFQHRTLQLLLSQPVDRMAIWREKMSIMVVAVLSVVLIFILGLRVAPGPGYLMEFNAVSVAWFIVSIASANFWILFSRSTIGGFVENITFNGCIFTAWGSFLNWNRGYKHFSPADTVIIYWTAAFIILCYSAIMLWLGRRMLARFQLTGGTAGGDLLMSGPNLAPEYLIRWFRSRPAGMGLNLVRKEFRLLRPLWLIMLMVVPIWTCVTIIAQFLPELPSAASMVQADIVLVFSCSCILISILTGALSLGEEKTSGTHSWHMTLPVSSGLQWLIKIVVALSAAFVCGWLIPMLVLKTGGLLPQHEFERTWLIAVLLLSLASFWCACMANGTVRAVLWILPVLIALALLVHCGNWAAEELSREVSSVSRTLLDMIASRLDADLKFTNAVSNIDLYIRDPLAPLPFFVLLWFVLPVLFMTTQSYRLFRTQLQESRLSMLRSLLPVATVTFLCAFSYVALIDFVHQAKHQMWTQFEETHKAIEKIHPGMAKLDASHPLQLTGEDLTKAYPLSERTRRWLRNSTLTVAPEMTLIYAHYCCLDNIEGYSQYPAKTNPSYIATIHMANGSECAVSLRLFRGGRGSYSHGILGGKCK